MTADANPVSGCNAAFAGHDPASEVATYVLLTISGRRAITACTGCADAALAMGMAIRADERREPRGTEQRRRRPEWLRRREAGELPAKDLTGWLR